MDARVKDAIWRVHTSAFAKDLRLGHGPRAYDVNHAIDLVTKEGGAHREQKAAICRARAVNDAAERGADVMVQAKALAKLPKAPCVVTTTALVPEFFHETGTLKLTTYSLVNRPLSQIARVVDPRSWGKCSDFFDPERTYRVPVVDGHGHRDASGEFARYKGPEEIGTTWAGLLRERFDGPGIAVDTVLCIDFVAGRKEVSLDYSLYLSDRCTLGPFTDIGGVRMNTGRLTATEVLPGVTKVDVYKMLRFLDYTPGDGGRWVDFGNALSLLIVMMGVVIDDKFVLKLCCDLDGAKH